MRTHRYCRNCGTMRTRTDIIEFGCSSLSGASPASLGDEKIKAYVPTVSERIEMLGVKKDKDLPDIEDEFFKKMHEYYMRKIRDIMNCKDV